MSHEEPIPFPTDDEQEPDYPEAVEQMFGHEPRRTNPVYIHDPVAAETHIVYGRSDDTLLLASTDRVVDPQTWVVSVEDIWNDWIESGLTFVQREFLPTDVGTYNTETQIPVRRLSAATMADELVENDLRESQPSDDVSDAIDEVYSLLDYSGDVPVEN